MSDPIADMLTRIRNALMAHKKETVFPASKFKFALAKILQKEGYIKKAEKITEAGGRQKIRVVLKYWKGEPVIQGIERVSKPGQRVYAKKNNIPYVLQKLGIAVVSTSSGLMTDAEARRKKIGGEIICRVW